jgi:hypothetical protein
VRSAIPLVLPIDSEQPAVAVQHCGVGKANQVVSLTRKTARPLAMADPDGADRR